MNISTDPAGPVSNIHGCLRSPRRQRGAISIATIGLVVALVLVAAGGAGYWFLMREDREDHAKAAVNAAITPRHYMAFKDMVVNLVNDETYDLHYLQLSVSLMTRNDKAFRSMEENRPLILNTMMELLPTWTFKDVMDPAKREPLRRQILDTLLKMPDFPQIKGLENVFITNMVIQ